MRLREKLEEGEINIEEEKERGKRRRPMRFWSFGSFRWKIRFALPFLL